MSPEVNPDSGIDVQEPQAPEQLQRQYLGGRERAFAVRQRVIGRRIKKFYSSLALEEAFYPEVAETLQALLNEQDNIVRARTLIRREITPLEPVKSEE